MKRRLLVIFLVIAALSLLGAHLNTSGRCPAGACEIGDSNVTSITLTTAGTGNDALVLPTNSVSGGEISNAGVTANELANGSVTYAKMGGVLSSKIVLCGQDANSGTIYGGPAAAVYLGSGAEHAIGGATCNALDSATEATADAPIAADYPALSILGMFCRTSTDATNDQVFTLRSAEANLSPSITCTVAGTGTDTSCTAIRSGTSPPTVAAGATIAVQSVNTEDLSLQDFWCEVYFSIATS